jgi:hypothetical protein
MESPSHPLEAIYRVAAVAAIVCLSGCNEDSLALEQVATGANGPSGPEASYFLSQREADLSWVPAALGPARYRSILSKVDFSHEMLVAVAAGSQQNFSGSLRIAEVYEYTGVPSRPINVRLQVGVFPSECFEAKESRPFGLAIVEQPKQLSPDRGYERQNFQAACKQR